MSGLIIALSLWGLVVALFWRLFKRSGAKAGDALAAAIALGFGLFLTVFGALHTISVAPIPMLDDVGPYDTRRVWLLTIGLIIVHTGLVNTALCRRVAHGERWALGMATTATTLFLVFLLILHPAGTDETVLILNLILMSVAYLALLLWRLHHHRGAKQGG